MKKKKIIVITIIVLLAVIVTTILINKNNREYIMKDGMMLALTMTDENGTTNLTSFPERGEYKVDVDCGNTATGRWLVEEWKLSIEKITGNVKCNVNFITNTTELKSEVESSTEEVNGGYISNNNTVFSPLTESEYNNNYKIFEADYDEVSGTEVTNEPFSYSDGTWTSVPENLENVYDETHFLYTIPDGEDAYYRICYSIPSSADGYYTSNALHLYKNTSKIFTYKKVSSEIQNDCVDLGLMFAGEYINISQTARSSSTAAIAPMSFYIEKKEGNYVSAGYRYSGKKPNNWVWFNDEKWRIIGSIPTCTSSGCATSENLVKIIRSEPIGSYTYDTSSTTTADLKGAWGSNTLYSLLNTRYYASNVSNMDASTHTGCYSYYESNYYPRSNCDFSEIGILADSYYGKMIKNVFWNTGASKDGETPVGSYSYEMLTQNISGYIGLMSASDYGYAADSSYYNKSLSLFSYKPYYNYSGTSTNENWIFNQGQEWTLTAGSQYSYYAYSSRLPGYLYASSVYYGYSVRPVVYLDPSVYIVSGDGSERNPYQIGM